MSIPLPKAFWPVTIDATNNKIYVRQVSTDYTGTIASATYYSAETLRAAVQTALIAAGGAGSWTVTLSATGRFAFVNSSTAFSTRFASLTTAAASTILGYGAVNLTATGSGPYTAAAPVQHTNGWYSAVAVRRDSGTLRDRTADRMTVTLAGQNKRIVEGEVTMRTLFWSYLTDAKTHVEFESSTTNEAIERWWRDGAARFRYWPDGTVEATYGDYFFDEETMQDFRPERMDTKALWSFLMKLRGYIA